MPAPQTSSPPPPPPEVGTYQAVLPENINPVDGNAPPVADTSLEGNAPPVADASLEGNDPTWYPDDAEDVSNHDGAHPEPNQVYDGSGEDYSDEEDEEDEEDNVNHGQPEHPHPIGTVFRHGRVDPFPSEDEVIDAIVDGAANNIFYYLRGPSPNVANGGSMTVEAINYVLEEMPHRQRNIRDLMDLLQRLQNRNRNDVEFLRSVREPAPPPPPPPPPALRRSTRLSGREGGN
jgi:hypothetical protein